MQSAVRSVPFQPFELERYQNKWENRVDYNLAESGVGPLSFSELLDITGVDPSELGALKLGYSQTDGTDELKAAIASMYPGAGIENVLVTVGSSEANFVSCWSLVERGTRVAIQMPTYKQIWGVAQNLGADVVPFHLLTDQGWALDEDSAREAITADTKLVVVTNPNNPTGHVLTQQERDTLIALTASNGAWLLADEVYRGGEHKGPITESFWGSADNVIVVGGLSKAYGLPGLRIGWVVGPAQFVADAAARHDYAVIGPSSLSDFLAIKALCVKTKLLARARDLVTTNYGVLDSWFREHGDIFSVVAPRCGAICFPRYSIGMESFELVDHLRKHSGVLLVPGSHFDAAKHLRFGFGYDRTALVEGLSRTTDYLNVLTKTA